MNVAARAKAFSPRTIGVPTTGHRHAAIRRGMYGGGNAAVFINATPAKRSGSATATDVPIAPPQSWATKRMRRRSSDSTSEARLSRWSPRR